MNMKAKDKSFWAKVTTQELYYFQRRYTNNLDADKVIQYWFKDYPIDCSHAARDGARVGNSKRLVNIEIITEEEATKYARPIK